MVRLTLEQLTTPYLPTHEVELAQLGGSVLVKALTSQESDAILEGPESGRAFKFIIAGIVEPKVTSNELRLLQGQNAGIIFELVYNITHLSGLDKDASEAILGKLKMIQNIGSDSNSATTSESLPAPIPQSFGTYPPEQ